jgi:hypothetical protein
MSVTIETIVACNLCGENKGADDRSYNAKQIRAIRKGEGWVNRGKEDYCPECWKLKQEPHAPNAQAQPRAEKEV